MRPDTEKLEISHNELAVIADALETQQKILMLQADAGTPEARQRLNAVKRLLGRLSTVKPKPVRTWTMPGLGGIRMRRLSS